MRTTNAAEAIVDLLAASGVRRLYTVPGESFLEVLDAADNHPDLTVISTRHESGAAFMAEGDAKITGRPAVAMATRCVGAANLAIGVHTAHQDSTPMIVLLGQVETRHLGKEAFQEVDLPRFYSEITVFAETVHRADRAAETVARALRCATGARPGPAMVALPADLLSQPCPPAAQLRAVAPSPCPSAEELDYIAAALRESRRPVAIVGGGAMDLHGLLTEVAERYGIGVYAAFRRQDAFPNTHRHYLGHLTLGTPEPILQSLREADLVLVLGSRLSEITTQAYTLPGKETRVIQVSPDPSALGAVVPAERAVVATVENLLQGLLAREDSIEDARGCEWSGAHQAYLRLSDPGPVQSSGTLEPTQVMVAMRGHLPADTIVANDAGNFSVWGHRYWRFDYPRTQVAPTSGAMGYGVPAGIGAQLAAPGRPVVALAGDGGFLMTGQELETAVRYQVPLLVIVFQNGLYGTIAMHQAREVGQLAGVDINRVDIAGYARSLGAEAVTVSRIDELDDAFNWARSLDRPRVLVVQTDPDVITPGQSLSGMLQRRG